MELVNHLPHPALAFEGVDTGGVSFHVLVMRQTLSWDDTGQLFSAEDQIGLCEEDEFFDPALQGSVRQESDLCQYKPRCDVLVNGHAYAPLRQGQPAPQFLVRVLVQRPVGSEGDRVAAYGAPPPALRLLDKSLQVHGQRTITAAAAPVRALRRAMLGLAGGSAWQLSAPRPLAVVPLRLEQAFGGECRSPVDGATPSPPHEAFAPNPVGCGWTREWFIREAGVYRFAAPQLEYPQQPYTAAVFAAALLSKPSDQAADLERLVAGLGVRPKGHPQRAALAGTIDERFVNSDAALPRDFDFAVWNAAWPDQQTEHLQGDERIALVNLCPAGTPGLRVDEHGNTVMWLALPGDRPFVLVRYANGALGEVACVLDTLLIEPDERRVCAVWRLALPKTPAVRVLELRALTTAEVADARGAGPGNAGGVADG